MRQSKIVFRVAKSETSNEDDNHTRAAASARAPVISLRQRSRIDSRRKLLAAARRLFTARGYEDPHPKDIAREAGVGYGTFYLHFRDKHECFLAFAADVCLAERQLNTSQDLIQANAEYNVGPAALFNKLVHMTLHPQTDSWYMDANIPGKPRIFMPFVCGLDRYKHRCDPVAAKNYDGFKLAAEQKFASQE